MFIPEFLFGVLATITLEMAAVIIAAVIIAAKFRKDSKKDNEES